MQLLPQGIADTLPPLYATENLPESGHMIRIKFTQWTWFVCEYDPKQWLCFGYVLGEENGWELSFSR
jgi:hypothetical protein